VAGWTPSEGCRWLAGHLLARFSATRRNPLFCWLLRLSNSTVKCRAARGIGNRGLTLGSLVFSPNFKACSFTQTPLKPEHKVRCKLCRWPCCWHGQAQPTRPPANPIRYSAGYRKATKSERAQALGVKQQETRAALPDMDRAA
jgi:hypothetical protein